MPSQLITPPPQGGEAPGIYWIRLKRMDAAARTDQVNQASCEKTPARAGVDNDIVRFHYRLDKGCCRVPATAQIGPSKPRTSAGTHPSDDQFEKRTPQIHWQGNLADRPCNTASA
jgi:hypothetical protein